MRRLALAILLLSGAAVAQPVPDQPPPPPQPPGAPGDQGPQQAPPGEALPPEQMAPPSNVPQPPGRRAHPLRERFEAANTTGDGHLTLEQAQAAHMPGVIKHFHEIDVDGKGYITFEEWTHWLAAMHQATPPTP